MLIEKVLFLVLKIDSMVADLSVPFPFGDYEMTARGIWKIGRKDITIKVTRSISREMTLSGSLFEGNVKD